MLFERFPSKYLKQRLVFLKTQWSNEPDKQTGQMSQLDQMRRSPNEWVRFYKNE